MSAANPTRLPFFTKPDLMRYLPIGGNYDGFDDHITDLLEPVSEAVRDYCRRDFDYSASFVEYFASQDKPQFPVPLTKLRLREPPIDPASTFATAITDPLATFEVFYNPNMLWDDQTTGQRLLQGYNYDVNLTSGTITIRWSTRYSPQGFKVQYMGGYTSGTGNDNKTPVTLVPSQVMKGAAMHGAFLLQRIISQTMGEVKASSDRNMRVFSPNVDTELIPEAKMFCNRYRRMLTGHLE